MLINQEGYVNISVTITSPDVYVSNLFCFDRTLRFTGAWSF